MNAKLLLALGITFCIAVSNFYGQTGPGGVGVDGGVNDLRLWLDASRGVTIDANNQVASWADVSGNNEILMRAGSGGFPSLSSSFVNGYDAVNANTSGYLLDTTINDGDFTDDFSFFIVVQGQTANAPQFRAVFTNLSNCAGGGGSTSDSFQLDSDGNGNWSHFTNLRRTVAPVNVNAWQLLGFDLHGRLLETFSDGQRFFSGNLPLIFLGNRFRDYQVGRNRGCWANFPAHIAEIIVYQTDVNAAQRIIVDNYLSAKYGMTLTANDLYTQDDTAQGNFDHRVAGIGQALDGSNQVDSQGTGIVRMSNPSTLNNNDYLFWGAETRNPTYNFTTNASLYAEQLTAKWRVSKVNDLGSVSVSFDISEIDISGKMSCAPLRLTVSNDAQFSSGIRNYDLTITGTTATAHNVMFDDADYFTLSYANEIFWDPDSTWGFSWKNGSGQFEAPGPHDECFKLTVLAGSSNNFPVINSEAHVREVEIQDGWNLTVANTGFLEVEEGINLGVDSELILQGESQLKQNHTGTSLNIGTGRLTIAQQGTSNPYNYNYWSAPVNRNDTWQIGYLEDANGSVNFVPSATPNPPAVSNQFLYTFPPSNAGYYGWVYTTVNTDILPGLGYTMKGSATGLSENEYNFAGTPNDGEYRHDLTGGPTGVSQLVLVGNPYPSALDANAFIADNGDTIQGTLYFWEGFSTNSSHNTSEYHGGYATYNGAMGLQAVAGNVDGNIISMEGAPSKPAPERYIPVGQGFFVQTLDNFSAVGDSGTLVFKNSQRALVRESDASGSAFFRANMGAVHRDEQTIDTRPKLRLGIRTPDGIYKQLGLGFDERATIGIDTLYDAHSFDVLNNDFFWVIEDQRFVIQGLPVLESNVQILIGFDVQESGDYMFRIHSLENFPDPMSIYLYDSYRGQYYQLSQEELINLSIEAGETNDRFFVTFSSETMDIGHKELNEIKIYYLSNTCEILFKGIAVEEVSRLEVFDMSGRNVRVTYPQKQIVKLSLASGHYIIKLSRQDGLAHTQKITVK